jgi:two-component system chemotaxis response regulator CheY
MGKLDNLNKNMPILVVDDYASMRRVLRNCLGQLGFKNVHEADTGAAALELISRQPFELIISDWFMPEMSGSELLQELQSKSEYHQVPVVVISPENQKSELMKQAEALGARDVIVKPFTASALEAKLGAVFEPKSD